MVTTSEQHGVTVNELNQTQGKILLDRAARHYLNMSADEFIRAWTNGEFNDDPERPGVIAVAMLLPFAQ